MQRNSACYVLSLVLVLTLCSCGGGGGDNPPPSPTVTTTPATGIGTDNATLNGTVNPNAQSTSAWLEWGTDSALSSFTATQPQAIGAGTTSQADSAPVSGLTSGTTYYYRVAASNASGTQKGAITSFTTAVPNSSPTVTSNAATPVTITAATLNGTVIPNELATTGWFEWGTDSNLASFTSTASQPLGSGKTSVPITATLSLSAGTTYYFRVAATNSVGTSKGAILSFNTVAQPPTVTTGAATSVTINGATLEGTVNPNGLATTSWLEWGTTPSLSTWTTTGNQDMGPGLAGVPINAQLSSLSARTTYYFRVAATNSTGTSKGNIVSFSTAAESPTAITAPATSITSDSAQPNGTVNPNGLATNAWFEWGTVFNLSSYTTTPMQPLGSGTTGVPINAQLSSLSPGTTYYFRVAATNSTGTSKGTIFSFTTSLSPTTTTQMATFNSATSAVLNGDVNPNGFATTAWFEYGTDPTLTIFSTTPDQSMGSGTSIVSFNASIPLSAYNTYYFRAVGINSGGTEKGDIKSFETGVHYVAVGDSITFAAGDDILADGMGYEPVLGNLLFNDPYTIANAGVDGTTSADGAASIATTLSNYPSAQYYLIMYGTNDSNIFWGPVPKATYKANMQAIITAIKNAGKIPYLAKVPYVDSSNPNFPAGENFSDVSIQQYNQAIDELVLANGIPITPPGFYAWFQSHTSQLQDGIHPTGVGYQSMANLWFGALP
jgi:lysophospholipase L1-like esterase